MRPLLGHIRAMIRPSLPVLAQRAHKPLISFVGKRVWAQSFAPAHPHPAAPPEYRKAFSSDLQQTAKTASENTFRDFWDAPARLWRPKHHQLQELEIEAIQTGGASLL